jgi:hypothetical protein
MEGHDYIWKMNPTIQIQTGNGTATGATFFSGEPTDSGQFCRFSDFNGNARSLYQNEAGVMYITPITLNHTQDSYRVRNPRWKIQV